MIDMVKRFFGKPASSKSASGKESSSHDVHVAVCALCIEIARIDEQFTPQELETILSILKAKYNLTAEHAEALIETAGN